MIDVEDLSKHKMESEQIIITEELCERVNKAYDEGHNICAVGTSVLRTVETTVSTDGHLKPRKAGQISLSFLHTISPLQKPYNQFPFTLFYFINDDMCFWRL